MNSDIRTLALSQHECALLKCLLRLDLPASIHAIVTASLPYKEKTTELTGLVDDYHQLAGLLTWQSTDTERAYRQVNSEAVIKLREVMVGTVVRDLDPMLRRAWTALAPGIMDGFKKALGGDDAPPNITLVPPKQPILA